MTSIATFYNADRSKVGTIEYSNLPDSSLLFDDEIRATCSIFLATDHLREFFRVNEIGSFERANKAIDEARRVGDRVFFIELHEHGGYVVRIAPTYSPICKFDSGLNGVIIVHADKWKKTINPIFTSAFVQKQMDWLAEAAGAWLNGTLYDFYVEGNGEDCAYGPFLSVAEAKKCMHDEYIDLVYTDDDFECVCTYVLKPAATARQFAE